MNEVDDQLRRLFAASKRSRPTSEETPPLGLETRVIAEWRSLREARQFPSFAPLFRQAVIWSIGISCLAIVSFLRDCEAITQLNSWQEIGLLIANSEFQRQIP